MRVFWTRLTHSALAKVNLYVEDRNSQMSHQHDKFTKLLLADLKVLKGAVVKETVGVLPL